MPQGQLRAFLLIAGAGAVLALVDLFGIAGPAIGGGLMLVGLVLSSPAAPGPGAPEVNWWALLGAGTLAAAIGVPLELLWELGGGLLVAAGGVLGVVGVALGLP